MNDSRRTFLQRSALVASASALSTAFLALAESAAQDALIRVTVTAADCFGHVAEPIRWGGSSGAAATLEVNLNDRRQTLQGFGAAFTDSSCYLISRMPAAARQKLLQSFLGPDGMRLSMGRTCIGASDYARNVYSYDDASTADPELKQFSIAHDREYILPVLREALALRPDLFLFSAPWSPPGWMKSGGSMLGGSMQKRYFAAYAQYFVRYLEGYAAEGVRIRAVTTQNEVDTDQEGKMPACLWGQEYETAFVKSFLGPALRAHHLDTQIWLLDHNYDLWGRVADQLSDPELAKFVSGIAWHGYAGKPEAMSQLHQSFPDVASYWTEGGPDYVSPDYETDWSSWGMRFSGILNHWSRAIVAWNLVLNEQGQPKIGPFDCGGLVTLDSRTGETRPSGQYHAMRHFSRAIPAGAQIVGVSSSTTELGVVAAIAPKGGCVLVVTNPGSARTAEIRLHGRSAQAHLAANSLTSFEWS